MTIEYSDEDDIFEDDEVLIEDEVLFEDEDKTEEVIIPIVKDCYYYYGVYAEDFKDLNYVAAINFKIQSANKLKSDLLIDGVANCDQYKLNDVINAIKFNKRLLQEIDPRVII